MDDTLQRMLCCFGMLILIIVLCLAILIISAMAGAE